jgi:hypothetical protein
MTATIVASNVKPEYAAPERYAGEWAVSTYMGRAHLIVPGVRPTHEGMPVHTACGKTLGKWFAATGRAWDGCVRCVAVAEPKP